MYIDDFIWLPEIVEKLAVKHHVTQEEAEEVFFHRPRYRFVESGYTPGEKRGNLALVVTARDMDKKERRRHERK